MLRAVQYLGPVGSGVTCPQLFRADDGAVYVVKLQNNRLGLKVLVNEYVAASLGQKLNLCFPPSDIIVVDKELLGSSRWLRGYAKAPGLQFGCLYLSHTNYLRRDNIARAVNKAQIAGVILFDHLFHNPDRTLNRKNMLLRHEKDGYRIYAIDNSHLFNRPVWTEEALRRLAPVIAVNHRRSYGLLLKHFLHPEDFRPYAAAYSALTDEELAAIVAAVPQEWLPDDQERQVLCRFMETRREMTDQIAARLCKLIPNVHRHARISVPK